jgi:hypothetical protein
MQRPAREVGHVLLLAAAVALAAWLSVRWSWRGDWSEARRASLADASVAALARLDGPLEIVSYARDDAALRGAIAAFVDRYRVHKRDLELRFIDPDLDPGAMRERGLRVDGELELRFGERRQRLTELSERAFTATLLRLARPHARVVAFVAGHGERRPDGGANHDWGRFARALAEQGVRTTTFTLSQQPQVPGGTDLVVLAAPRVALGPGEIGVLLDHLERGGALWWLLEPETDAAVEASMAPLYEALGARRLPGTVVDATAQGLGIGDPSFLALTHYPEHGITREFDLTTLLPQVAALGSVGALKFAAQPVLRTAARSWTESGPIADAIAYDAGGSEMPGPHDVAYALSRLSPSPAQREQRVLVVGDADFLADRWLGNGGNLALGLRMLNWLTGDDALADLAPPSVRDRVLALSEAELGAIGALFLVALPLALAACGGVIAWRRRRR